MVTYMSKNNQQKHISQDWIKQKHKSALRQYNKQKR